MTDSRERIKNMKIQVLEEELHDLQKRPDINKRAIERTKRFIKRVKEDL